VGTQARLNGGLFTIVGVTPSEFPGPQLGVYRDVYVPMMMQALMRPPRAGYSGEMNPDLLHNRNNGWLMWIARLEPGVTREQGQAAEAVGGHAPRLRRRRSAADRVRERGQPAAIEGGGAPARGGDPAGAGRQPLADRAAVAHRERAAGGDRRRGGRAAGVARRA